MFPLILLCFLFSPNTATTHTTFINATFKTYSVYVLKLTETIESSNDLKPFLPKYQPYDKVEFLDQNIPVLYENSISDIPYLDELVIEQCNLQEIRLGAFKNVSNLRRLSLKGNAIREINAGVFNWLPISTLDVSRNGLEVIESTAFDDLPNLLNIVLSDNKIMFWDANWFRNTPLLTRISMQNNTIEKLQENAFKNLQGRKKYGKINLAINLIFSHNKITEIHEETFKSLEEINNLWLDYNQLETFNGKLLENVKKINELRIDNNAIKCLDGDLNVVLKATTNHIDSNPFECECLEKIKNWSKKNEKHVTFFFSAMNCDVERIRNKMDDLKKRLKGLKEEEEEEIEDMNVSLVKPVPIK